MLFSNSSKVQIKMIEKEKNTKLNDIDKLKRISGPRPCQTDWL